MENYGRLFDPKEHVEEDARTWMSIGQFERIPSDGDDLHMNILMNYSYGNLGLDGDHHVWVEVALKAVELPYESEGIPFPEGFEYLGVVPAFSHLLSDPVISQDN